MGALIFCGYTKSNNLIAKYIHSQQLRIKLHIAFENAEASILNVEGSEPITSEVIKNMIIELDKHDFVPNNKIKHLYEG